MYTEFILEAFGSKIGDLAVIAEHDDKKVGAAFIRYWNADTNIRGYISEEVPVLVIGVDSDYRRQGVASGLINSIKSIAIENGISEISLCVTKSNIAYRLYLKTGFKIVDDIESSYNMHWKSK